MAGNKLVRQPGVYLDVTPFHGKWITINMKGNDIGYAQVGVISSGKDFILFQYKDKTGLAAKAFIKDITEVKMSERKLKRQRELVTEEWDPTVNPFTRFLGKRCNIHVHATKLFEGNPGFFAARIDNVSNGIVTIKENGKTFHVYQYMIVGLMES